MGAGRPTSYKSEFTEQAYKLCLLGATDVDLADFFDVCEATINNWKTNNPEFLESIHAGKKVADIDVAESLYLGAKDRIVPKQQAFKVKEVFWDSEGRRCEREKVEVIVLDEFMAGDFRNQQFWLKNRKSDVWKDKHDVDHTSSDGSMSAPTKIVFTRGSSADGDGGAGSED